MAEFNYHFRTAGLDTGTAALDKYIKAGQRAYRGR